MESMIVRHLDKDRKPFDYIDLLAVGDAHIGSRLHDDKLIAATIDYIKEIPNRFVIINGDMVNNNLPGSVGSPYEDKYTPKDQRKLAKEIIQEIKNRVICIVGGNHERRTKKVNDESPLEQIAEDLSIPYREEDAFIKLTFGKDAKSNKRLSYQIYATHGAGGGKRPGSSLNNIESLTMNCFSEIYIMNHVHKKTAHKAVYYMPDAHNENIREIEMLYVISSSFQDYGGYAKQKLLRPSAKGAVPIYLSGKEKYYKAEV